MERHALRVAVAQGVDLREGVLAADEGVVRRHGAVGKDAQHLGRMAPEVLGELAPAAIAGGDVEIPFAVEQQPRAEVAAGGCPSVGDEDHLHLLEAVAGEAAAGDAGAGEPVLAERGIGEVDEAVGGEIRIEGDVEEAALALGPDLRQTAHRSRVERAVGADAAQAADALGDQHRTVGQEGEAPGTLEPVGHEMEPETLHRALEDLARLRRPYRRAGAEGGAARDHGENRPDRKHRAQPRKHHRRLPFAPSSSWDR